MTQEQVAWAVLRRSRSRTVFKACVQKGRAQGRGAQAGPGLAVLRVRSEPTQPLRRAVCDCVLSCLWTKGPWEFTVPCDTLCARFLNQ